MGNLTWNFDISVTLYVGPNFMEWPIILYTFQVMTNCAYVLHSPLFIFAVSAVILPQDKDKNFFLRKFQIYITYNMGLTSIISSINCANWMNSSSILLMESSNGEQDTER